MFVSKEDKDALSIVPIAYPPLQLGISSVWHPLQELSLGSLGITLDTNLFRLLT